MIKRTQSIDVEDEERGDVAVMAEDHCFHWLMA